MIERESAVAVNYFTIGSRLTDPDSRLQGFGEQDRHGHSIVRIATFKCSQEKGMVTWQDSRRQDRRERERVRNERTSVTPFVDPFLC